MLGWGWAGEGGFLNTDDTYCAQSGPTNAYAYLMLREMYTEIAPRPTPGGACFLIALFIHPSC